MTSEQFAYWLQGFSELNDGPPDEAQWQSIKDHLATVFTKVTPRINSGIAQQARPADHYLARTECMARPVAGGDGNTFAIC